MKSIQIKNVTLADGSLVSIGIRDGVIAEVGSVITS